ncbi:MAG TPA: 3-hydroxyacyl-CoA dehydrogenase NAD-binding domain-containing protein [Kofleriaceae bacterium]|jgi:3-hydroxybutyryl-CoA dehydrogenase|nr:3-hydroxyacyl-CoA dehydrogenase NAD-binding domain-containing protein [Kofleriaceae bacterium]
MFEIHTVGIIGAGLMGTGIAEVCALAGLRTILIRATGGDSAAAVERVRASMQARVARGKLAEADATAALGRLHATGDLAEAAACDLVIESIVEDLATKRDLFARLAPHLKPTAILASNTSTLKIADLADGPRAPRTLGLHFFSPVPAMSLVEIAHLPVTDPDALEAAQRFVARLGKTAVPVLDSTGFIVNRLLVPVLVGAIAAYEQGLASAEHIDTAMKLGCGHPMGPLALADLIGLDVVYAMSKLLYKEFGDDRFRPPALLRRLVQNGQLGKKAGLGLYDYRVKPPRGNLEALATPHAEAA